MDRVAVPGFSAAVLVRAVAREKGAAIGDVVEASRRVRVSVVPRMSVTVVVVVRVVVGHELAAESASRPDECAWRWMMVGPIPAMEVGVVGRGRTVGVEARSSVVPPTTAGKTTTTTTAMAWVGET